MLTKQEEEALTTSAQATAQYVADLSDLPAVQQQNQNDAQVPTSNVAQLDLPQDYQAHFSAAQAQAVAQAAAAAMTQANNGNYPVDFAAATSASMESQTSQQQQVSNEMYRKSLISEKVSIVVTWPSCL
jgi:hypothetical protein